MAVGRHGSRRDVRKNIARARIASHCRARTKFDAPARRLVKKGMLTDDKKGMKALSLTMDGVLYVKGYLEDNPGALEGLDSILER